MSQYLMRRLLLIPLLVIGITLLDFMFINLTPGDPVSALMNPNELVGMDPQQIEFRREQLGLNKPIVERYVIWLKEMATGNLGYSIAKSQPVSTLMWNGIKNTVVLMGLSIVISAVIGILFGIISALKPHSWVDYLLTTAAFVGVGMPSFFFALILINVGALNLGWFPTSGIITPGDGSLTDRLQHLVLPLIALSINGSGSIMRYMRAGLIEVMHEDYVTTARAKGLKGSSVVMSHAVRNALLPIITVLGLQIPRLFGGAVVIETIFNIPGIGLTMVQAMNTKDYPLIMGGILLTGIMVLISSLIADIAYAIADPRIRY
ncbi:MAG: ABC transporter permease [Thermomicrobiales bacterium]|nr:ABC transporter permease [Thermomicrobiales bacterium]